MENNITFIDEGSVSKYCKNSNAFWYAKLYKREDYRIEVMLTYLIVIR